MPFTKYNNDIYMGYYDIYNGNYLAKVKKLNNSGNWIDIPEQPGQNFITPYLPKTYFDIEATSNGDLYLAMLKGDNFNYHLSVIKLDIITGIMEPQKGSCSIYPNPSSGIVNLTGLRNLKGFNGVEITDINGKTIFTKAHKGTCTLPCPLQIDLSNHPKGVYFIKIKTNESIYTKKLIIQ
jgi:hypothetical protein